MYQLVLIRHGESQWNQENRFTGWQDVDLSAQGVEEALEAGRILKQEGFVFQKTFTSVLKRAIRTWWIVLDELNQVYLPVVRSWRLNERHYGALTGLNKTETAQKYGEEQVKIWRRSFDTPPPLLAKDSEYHPRLDVRYQDVPDQDLPLGESLKDTVHRFMPFWESDIKPALLAGERVLVVAHGNSLRALLMHLENLTQGEIMEVNLPTGIPLVFDLDKNLKVLQKRYLASKEKLDAALNKVAAQGKAKN